MELTLFRLHFTTPLHISTVRADYDVTETRIHSDTLYAAIMQAWSALGKTELIKENPDFTLTGLFPFYNKEKDKKQIVYFLPKPIGTLKHTGVDDRKEIKKIIYLEQSLFEKLLHGDNISTNQKNGIFLYPDSMEINHNGIFESHVVMRNRVPRDPSAKDEHGESVNTEPYYVDRLFFHDDSGLFFLFKGNEESKKNVTAALEYLADEGIGTDRHVGNGLFELVVENEKTDWFKNLLSSEHVVSLSMFLPENKEQLTTMLDDKCAYELIQRGGWITNEKYNTLRKKSINMFSEGSIFNATDSIRETGEAGIGVNLKPDISLIPEDKKDIHDVFRVGKSFFLPITIG